MLLKLFEVVYIIVVKHAIVLKTRKSILTSFIAVLFLVSVLLTHGHYHIFRSISLYLLLMICSIKA